jgi:hypothetical protein
MMVHDRQLLVVILQAESLQLGGYWAHLQCSAGAAV